MSQPALSRNLKKLEQDLGVTLFTREARGIKLTPEGAFVGERAQAMVAMADRMERELHTVHSRLTGSIAIGCAETLSMSRQAMAELLKKLETSGHISRRPSRRDSRVMMVNLTNQGRKAADLLGKAPDQTSSMLDCSMKPSYKPYTATCSASSTPPPTTYRPRPPRMSKSMSCLSNTSSAGTCRPTAHSLRTTRTTCGHISIRPHNSSAAQSSSPPLTSTSNSPFTRHFAPKPCFKMRHFAPKPHFEMRHFAHTRQKMLLS